MGMKYDEIPCVPVLSVSQMGVDERPDGRMIKYGPETLSEDELWSLSLGVDGILKLADSIYTHPFNLCYDELVSEGFDSATAIRIVAISELSKRLWRKQINKTALNCPSSVADYYRQKMAHNERESLIVAFGDMRNRYFGDMTLTTGTVDSSLVSVREVLIEALKRRACSIVLVHNHPAGSPEPSSQDIQVTDSVNNGCRTVGIRLLDHVIIGEGGNYYSFREHERV